MSLDYRWVVTSQLAAGAHPARDMPLGAALRLLRRNGVRAILTLHEQPIPPAALAQAGLESRHIPVVNYDTPTLDQLREGVGYIATQVALHRPVYVHCWAGIGRTGTFVAAYLASTGMDSDAAVNRIRALRPGSIETAEQLAQVHCFAASLRRSATPRSCGGDPAGRPQVGVS